MVRYTGAAGAAKPVAHARLYTSTVPACAVAGTFILRATRVVAISASGAWKAAERRRQWQTGAPPRRLVRAAALPAPLAAKPRHLIRVALDRSACWLHGNIRIFGLISSVLRLPGARLVAAVHIWLSHQLRALLSPLRPRADQWILRQHRYLRRCA